MQFCTKCNQEKQDNEFYKGQQYCKECIRKATLRKKYGITAVTYNKMYDAQKGKCFICGTKAERNKLAVDHEHSTGKIRKLLCHHCNVLLGHAKEDIEILTKAISYLMEHKNAG